MNVHACERATGSGPETSSSRPIDSGVLDELVRRGLHAPEERPPDRLALAVVVVEELAGERGRGIARLQQREAELGARDLLRLLLLRVDGRRRRDRPELGDRLGLPLE